MTHKTLECGPTPAIKIEIHGDARIEGWDKNEIQAKGDGEIELAPDGEAINLKCKSDCEVMLPRGAAVAVMAIGGDARIRDITGSVAVGSVGGDCSIKRVAMLNAQNVGGDAELICEKLGGVNLNVGGDVMLLVKTGPLQSFSVKCGGDIECKLPLGSNVRVNITDGEGRRSFASGDGSVAVSLTCGGEAHLAGAGNPREARSTDFNFDFGKTFGPGFSEHISKRISEQLEARLKDKAERMAQKAMRHSERAARQAQAHAERLAHKAERKAWRGFGFGANFGDETPVDTSGAPEPAAGASDEERMTILRMLEQKKITAEQAEQLLSALA